MPRALATRFLRTRHLVCLLVASVPARNPASSPHPVSSALEREKLDASLRRRFGVAWIFLLLSALLGFGLRLQVVQPWATLEYAHLLHTHSHLAFLGWVFNAFFVVSLRHFIPAECRGSYDWLWWTMQAAVAGMLATFPFQGYAPASIAFSTVHMVASFAFALKLWRRNHASPAARPHLHAALIFMLLSGLGPLALGPLASAGLRDSPAYTLAVYFYLHCQYNGWFLFFLQALALQLAHERAWPVCTSAALRAAGWLFAGNVLAYALSTLWCDPPAWVRGAAIAGGALQIIGCVEFARAFGPLRLPSCGIQGILLATAIAGWLLKHALHALGGWPAFNALLPQRFVAIAFLHLIFLGVVLPALIAWAAAQGWFRSRTRFRIGALLLLAGVAATELLLLAPTVLAAFGWFPEWPLARLLAAASALLVVALFLTGDFRRGAKMP